MKRKYIPLEDRKYGMGKPLRSRIDQEREKLLEELSHCTFQPQINQPAASLTERRNVDDLMEWGRMRDFKLIAKRNEAFVKANNEFHKNGVNGTKTTQTPKLAAKSASRAKLEKSHIYYKKQKEEKIEKLRAEVEKEFFKPKINKKSEEIINEKRKRMKEYEEKLQLLKQYQSENLDFYLAIPNDPEYFESLKLYHSKLEKQKREYLREKKRELLMLGKGRPLQEVVMNYHSKDVRKSRSPRRSSRSRSRSRRSHRPSASKSRKSRNNSKKPLKGILKNKINTRSNRSISSPRSASRKSHKNRSRSVKKQDGKSARRGTHATPRSKSRSKSVSIRSRVSLSELKNPYMPHPGLQKSGHKRRRSEAQLSKKSKQNTASQKKGTPKERKKWILKRKKRVSAKSLKSAKKLHSTPRLGKSSAQKKTKQKSAKKGAVSEFVKKTPSGKVGRKKKKVRDLIYKDNLYYDKKGHKKASKSAGGNMFTGIKI